MWVVWCDPTRINAHVRINSVGRYSVGRFSVGRFSVGRFSVGRLVHVLYTRF